MVELSAAPANKNEAVFESRIVMRVKELIKRLQVQDEDLEVRILWGRNLGQPTTPMTHLRTDMVNNTTHEIELDCENNGQACLLLCAENPNGPGILFGLEELK